MILSFEELYFDVSLLADSLFDLSMSLQRGNLSIGIELISVVLRVPQLYSQVRPVFWLIFYFFHRQWLVHLNLDEGFLNHQ